MPSKYLSSVSLNLCRHPLVTISSGSKSYQVYYLLREEMCFACLKLVISFNVVAFNSSVGKKTHWTSDFCLICRNKNLPNVSSAVSSLWTLNLVFCPCSHCYSPTLNLFQCYSISWSGGLRWDELTEYRDIKLASVFLKLEIS